MSTDAPYSPREKTHVRDGRVDLMAFDRAGLERWFVDQGEKRFRGHQVFKWIWQRGVVSPEEMTNLNKTTRAWLQDTAVIPRLETAGVQHSEDGTRKYLWECFDGSHIESAPLS